MLLASLLPVAIERLHVGYLYTVGRGEGSRALATPWVKATRVEVGALTKSIKKPVKSAEKMCTDFFFVH